MTTMSILDYSLFATGALFALFVPLKHARLFAGLWLFRAALRVMPFEARKAFMEALQRGLPR